MRILCVSVDLGVSVVHSSQDPLTTDALSSAETQRRLHAIVPGNHSTYQSGRGRSALRQRILKSGNLGCMIVRMRAVNPEPVFS